MKDRLGGTAPRTACRSAHRDVQRMPEKQARRNVDRCTVHINTKYRVRINYQKDFAKPYFHKYWTEIHDITTIWKMNVCSFIVTLNAFDVRPTCDTADVQTILPFPPNPPKHVLCDVPDCRVDGALAILAVFLDVVGCKHCPWWNATGRNHTLSGLVTGVARCKEGVVCGRCTTNPSTWHVFVLVFPDLLMPFQMLTFTVCNRHEFHDLAALLTQVMA